jgi:hypothetical protein
MAQKGSEIVFSATDSETGELSIRAEESFEELASKLQAEEWVAVTQAPPLSGTTTHRCLVNTAAVAFLRERFY